MSGQMATTANVSNNDDDNDIAGAVITGRHCRIIVNIEETVKVQPFSSDCEVFDNIPIVCVANEW